MHKREFRALICSMLLGDGCLSYGKNPGIGKRGNPIPHNVFYCMNHSVHQADYALWKASLIDNIFKEKGINRKCTYTNSKKYDKKYDKTYYGLYVKFSWAEYLRPLRKKTYLQLAEKIHLKNIEYLLANIHSDLHTAIWFGDDGNEKRKKRKSVRGTLLGYDNPYYRLFTFGYTKGQHQIIKQWFEKHYKVSPVILKENAKTEGKNLYMKFSVADSKKLFERLHPYLAQTESMKKKFWLSFARYMPNILETPQLVDEDIVQTTTSKDGLGN